MFSIAFRDDVAVEVSVTRSALVGRVGLIQLAKVSRSRSGDITSFLAIRTDEWCVVD